MREIVGGNRIATVAQSECDKYVELFPHRERLMLGIAIQRNVIATIVLAIPTEKRPDGSLRSEQ